MKCPECGFEIGSLPCWLCERQALDHEWEFKSLIKEFPLPVECQKPKRCALLWILLSCAFKSVSSKSSANRTWHTTRRISSAARLGGMFLIVGLDAETLL